MKNSLEQRLDRLAEKFAPGEEIVYELSIVPPGCTPPPAGPPWPRHYHGPVEITVIPPPPALNGEELDNA